MNLKIILILCGLVGFLYLIWPILKLIVMGYLYHLIIDYGIYFLLFLAGGGYYVWRRLKT